MAFRTNFAFHKTRVHTGTPYATLRRADERCVTRASPACLTHALKHREPENKAKARENSSGAATVGRRSAAVAPHGRRGQVGPDVSMSTRNDAARARTDAEEDGVDGTRRDEASRTHA